MRKIVPFLFAVLLGLAVTGCQGLTSLKAPAAYKDANRNRLNAVEPMLQTYATDHPTDAQKVSDITRSWHVEVNSQQANP